MCPEILSLSENKQFPSDMSQISGYWSIGPNLNPIDENYLS